VSLPGDGRMTTEMLLTGALIFAVVDAAFLPLLAWRVRREVFLESRWALAGATALFWFGVWSLVLTFFWDTIYRYVFPGWARSFIPPVYGLAFGGLSLFFCWLARRSLRSLHSRIHPVVIFCLLGGCWGVVTHILAVQLGIVTKPPMLQGASPVAAVVIAAFEFTFYWCIITSIGVLAQLAARRIGRLVGRPG